MLFVYFFWLVIINSPCRYKGVLLYGPPGTGKTSLATYCAHGVGASLFSINGPEIISQYYGESEQALHDVFESARRAAPSVVRFFASPYCLLILKTTFIIHIKRKLNCMIFIPCC